MRFTRFLLVLSAFAAGFCSLAPRITAQEASSAIVSQPGVPILNFDVENLGPILNEMELLWQSRQTPDGRPFILVNAEGETVFVLSPLACRGNAFTDCVGLQYISVFDGQADPEVVREFNNRYAVADLGINEIGNAYLNRYDIADYGIARGNVATLISTFAVLSTIYQDTVGGDGVDLSSNTDELTSTVNAALALLSEGVPLTENTAISTTLIRAQESGNNLDTVFADQALPKNKILNIDQ